MAEAKNLRSERFAEKPDETFVEFNDSLKFDRRLFEADIQTSIAYCEALFQAGVLTRPEAERIKNGLWTILKRADFDKNYFNDTAAPSVHSFIEIKLVQLLGETGRKLRTGRSRNDQIVTCFRLWMREEIFEISRLTRLLQKTLLAAAEAQKEAVLPSYAHLQKAQPILWAHWCLAYFEMFDRDRERLDEVWRRVNVLPLGAGTGFDIDRETIAKELGFEGVAANSLDAVSDRDFAIEFVGACALLMIHLSRLAEDLILYASREFGFIELGDTVSIDSFASLPDKKNLEVLELMRGKTGRVLGHQTALVSLMKGLPLAVNKDMQEDKEAVFDTVDTVKICLQVAGIVLKNLRVKEERSREAAEKGYFAADELCDYLVHKGISFDQAQDTVEKIMVYAVSVHKNLTHLSLQEMQKFSAGIEKDVFEALSLEHTLAGKNQIGGTAPERVLEALEKAKLEIEREEP